MSELPERIEFIASHRPALPDGDYRVTVEQTLGLASGDGPRTPFRSAVQRFAVAGARFELTPDDVQAVFPPAGSLGEHSNVLPHVVLRRSTLPWERQADPDDESKPWLALLLFQEGEVLRVTSRVVSLSTLTQPSTGPVHWPGVDLEVGQQADDKVTVIDVPVDLMRQIVPSASDLSYQAHVRLPIPEPPPGDEAEPETAVVDRGEQALVFGNRLPEQATLSTVHLVSVEGRYSGKGFVYGVNADDAVDADDSIRLVSLKSWRFACMHEEQSFERLLAKVNDLDRPQTLRLPEVGDSVADGYLASGFVALPHAVRRGGRTVSWYHGPLIPGKNETEVATPVGAADELLRYDPANGLFDASYAAAWELGRLLALQSPSFSVALFQWKRAHKQHLAALEQSLLHGHLPVRPDPRSVGVPDSIRSWFRRLSLLEGVPFPYLVPDERMLPKESLRFFHVDPAWMDCLLDGAFSVGRVGSADFRHDRDHTRHAAENPHPALTGFLLRSDVVAGWPDLQVDGYGVVPAAGDQRLFELPVDTQVELLRMERLSANVLICLFEKEVRTVDVHQKPEALHFGVNRPDLSHDGYFKNLRDAEGEETSHEIEVPIDSVTRVIDLQALARSMKDKIADETANPFAEFTSAQFAMEMIEGVQKVRFIKRS